MSEADIIATLYFDVMDIYRKEKVVNEHGVTELKENLIASNIKCSLDKKDEVTSNGEVGSIVSGYKVFCRPTVDIKIGDKLVITYNGLTHTFEAGEPYPYQSHLEVPVIRMERV